MKVYTEVNYEFKNGVLVEQSSKSYEYKGEVSLCGGGGTKAVTNLGRAVTDTVAAVKNPAAAIEGGPGGTLGQITDSVYGGSFKELVEGAQGKTEDVAAVAADLTAEEIDPQAALTAQNAKRKVAAGRGAANMTAGQSATMLTA
mgnify:CR=1 FL=1